MSVLAEDIIEQGEARLQKINEILVRRRHRIDPTRWGRERLGVYFWSKQREIIEALQIHRKVAVRSCHDVGKSFIAAAAVGHWIDTLPLGKAFCVTTAPTAAQVRAILWREIGRVYSRGNLAGRVNQTEWLAIMPSGVEELIAFGRKPDDYDATAFQGIHAPFVLVVVDEACGVRGALWEAADSLIANDGSKVLAIGNPDIPNSEFDEICRPGSGWFVIEISAFDSPNFTGEIIAPDPELDREIKQMLVGPLYVEDKRRKWASNWRWNETRTRCEPPLGVDPQQTNPFWQSKILGKFPRVGVDGGLIPFEWIVKAQMRTLEPLPGDANELGCDVGGGGDATTVAHRRGPVVRIIDENHNPDTMKTCGLFIALQRSTGATMAKVDVVGIGRGVVDRGAEVRAEYLETHGFVDAQTPNLIGINVGEAADDNETFANKRAELWWAIRERFEEGSIDIDPNDDDLAAELVEIRFKRNSRGQIQIESKDEAKRRGIPSPNRADALMLSFAPVAERPKAKATWGLRRKGGK